MLWFSQKLKFKQGDRVVATKAASREIKRGVRYKTATGEVVWAKPLMVMVRQDNGFAAWWPVHYWERSDV